MSRQSLKPWARGRWREDASEPVGLLLVKVCDGVQRLPLGVRADREGRGPGNPVLETLT